MNHVAGVSNANWACQQKGIVGQNFSPCFAWSPKVTRTISKCTLFRCGYRMWCSMTCQIHLGSHFSHAFRMSSKSSSRSSSATCFEWRHCPIVTYGISANLSKVKSLQISEWRMTNSSEQIKWNLHQHLVKQSFQGATALDPTSHYPVASSSKRSAKCEKQAPANCGDLTLVDALDTSQNFRSETCLTFPLEWSNSTIYDSMAKPRLCLATKSKSCFTHPAATCSFSWKQKALGATSSHMHSFSWDANDDDQQLRLKHGTRTSLNKALDANVCKTWWIKRMNHDKPFDSDIKKHLLTDSCCMNFVLHWDSKYIVCNTWHMNHHIYE